jgi:DNA modification methylase
VKPAHVGKYLGAVLNQYQKPLSLMGKFIKAFTRPGDYIVDVTAGTCTTAVRNVIDLLTPV